MTLLLRDTDDRVDEPAVEPAAAPPEPPPVARQCATCGAEMAPEQDWCLACGQAAPGRLGGRPGMRAAATVVVLTLVLAGGAVAASYAALQGDSNREAAKAPGASGAPIAQAPPAAPPAAAPATPPATPPAPPAGAKPKMPKAVAPPAVSAPPVPVAPSTPPASQSPSTPSAPSKQPSKPAAPAGPEPIDLGADAVQLYDPYTRATDQGDPVDAYDGDRSTAWNVTTPSDGKEMALGLVVDLGAKRKLDSLELVTGTPGFRAEIYATDSGKLPPDVLDTRWAHLRDARDVEKGKTTVSLGAGSVKYRYVLVWFTTPPTKGTTVRVAELGLLG